MTGQPWFKFWPAAWRSDLSLRTCSSDARGLWIDMLCLMHEGIPRGHLSLHDGRAIDPTLLATLCNVPVEKVRALLAELRKANVYSVTPQGVIFSRKMVRDEERSRRGREHGKTGGNPQLLTGRVIPLRRKGLSSGLTPGDKTYIISPLSSPEEEPTSKEEALGEDGPFTEGAA